MAKPVVKVKKKAKKIAKKKSRSTKPKGGKGELVPLRYRAALIGCGNIARAHAQGYKGVERIDLVAGADPDEQKGRVFAEQFDIPQMYADYREMLDAEKPDIVSICTWHPLHAEMTIAAAARHPRAILCEKPMATSLGEAEEMIVACRRNDVKLAVGFQRRFTAAWTRARELIAAGTVGKVKRVSHARLTGLLNATSHGLDCMRYILGDPEVQWVFAQVERKTDRYERSIRCEDCIGGFLYFDGDVQVNFQTDMVGDQKWAFVQGAEGMLDFDDGWVRYFNSESGGWRDVELEPVDVMAAQARELVDWIEGHCEHRGHAGNGLWSMQMMMGAYESARLHERVYLPVQTRANPLDLMVESGHLPVERPGRYDVRSFLLSGEAMDLEY